MAEYTGFDASRKTQRNLIVGDEWPEGEIDEVSNRYIQFGITPSAGTTLKIDSIGMFVCGCGGNGMMCHVNYSTKPDFADQRTIFAPTSMPANNMLPVSATPVISLNEGDILTVRVYPWYNNKATGKTICISDVVIRGVAVDNTNGINTAMNRRGEVVCEKYFDITGRCIAKPRKGLNIVQRVLADGTCETRKVNVNR